MILINEWLPNPTGNDAAGEFVELKNTGGVTVSVSGWSLVTQLKKREKISGAVPAGGYLVLYRKDTKLVLKNSDEGIALYDATGKLVDQSSFPGTAPEGKSFSRIENLSGSYPDMNHLPMAGEEGIQNFAWAEPTPGATNHAYLADVAVSDYPFGVPLSPPVFGMALGISMMFGVALLLTSLVVYSFKKHEDLSELFFGRNEAAG